MDGTINRDLFITENIINYLQTTFPNYYGDNAIIKKYKKYIELLSIKKASEDDSNVKFSIKNQEKLNNLHIYFYGNSDGSNAGSGNSLANKYLNTIESIKSLIDSNNTAINDTVSNIYDIVESSDTTTKEAFTKYINQIIIPGLQAENSASSPIAEYTIKKEEIKEDYDVNLYNQTIETAKNEATAEKQKKQQEIEKYKAEEKQRNDKTKEDNIVKRQKEKEEEAAKKIEKETKENEEKEEIDKKKFKENILEVETKFQEIQNLIINSDYKDYYNTFIDDYINLTLNKATEEEKIKILKDLQSNIKLIKKGGVEKTEEELKQELDNIKQQELEKLKTELIELKQSKDNIEKELEKNKLEFEKIKHIESDIVKKNTEIKQIEEKKSKISEQIKKYKILKEYFLVNSSNISDAVDKDIDGYFKIKDIESKFMTSTKLKDLKYFIKNNGNR